LSHETTVEIEFQRDELARSFVKMPQYFRISPCSFSAGTELWSPGEPREDRSPAGFAKLDGPVRLYRSDIENGP
jgi:hypothetical protein